MSNIVIASNDALCQSAKNWFIKNVADCLEGPPIDALLDGEKLYVIAHANELGDATAFCSELHGKYDFPMTDWEFILIVCSAAALTYESDLKSPAETIANAFNRNVYASKSIVIGSWDANGATFTGDFETIRPGDDVTSKMQNLSLS